MMLRCSCDYRDAHTMVDAGRSETTSGVGPRLFILFETEFHCCSLLCIGEGKFTSKNFPISAFDHSVEVFDLQTCMSCLVF